MLQCSASMGFALSLGISCLFASDGGKPLPPVDVTESVSAGSVEAASGWVSVDSLVAKPLPPVVDEQTLGSSRAFGEAVPLWRPSRLS